MTNRTGPFLFTLNVPLTGTSPTAPLEKRASRLADDDRAGLRRRLARLDGQTNNGTPPRVIPGQPIPGEEPDNNY